MQNMAVESLTDQQQLLHVGLAHILYFICIRLGF